MGTFHPTLTVTIGHNKLNVTSDNGFSYTSCGDFFSWDSQLYMGVNRVVSDSEGTPYQAPWNTGPRAGSGLCDACISWLSSIELSNSFSC